MYERAVFLDRDNTIIENDGYLGDPSKVKLLPGAATALSAMRALGYRLIVVSNQSGVARGMFDEAAVEAVNQEMSRQLQEQAGAYVDASYYCPYHPEAPIAEYRLDHDWRKPKPGMLKQAATDFGLDLSQCWLIGDAGRDIAAGAAAGCRTILLRDPDRTPSKDAASRSDPGGGVSPSFVVRTLADAARIIAREGRNPPASPAEPAVDAGRLPPPAGAVAGGKAEPAGAPSAVQEPAAMPPSPASAVLNEAAAAERPPARLGEGRAGGAASAGLPPKLERSLDELVAQLRLQNRQAELQPEFSKSNVAALILQILAAAALLKGIYAYVSAPMTFKVGNDLFIAEMAHLAALLWVMVAAVLQGMVIALLLRLRNR